MARRRSRTQERTQEPSRRSFWTTMIAIALILPIPLALGMGLMTGIFSHSAHEALMSLASYYVLWLVVDVIGIAWTVFRHRHD